MTCKSSSLFSSTGYATIRGASPRDHGRPISYRWKIGGWGIGRERSGGWWWGGGGGLERNGNYLVFWSFKLRFGNSCNRSIFMCKQRFKCINACSESIWIVPKCAIINNVQMTFICPTGRGRHANSKSWKIVHMNTSEWSTEVMVMVSGTAENWLCESTRSNSCVEEYHVFFVCIS